MILNGRLAGLRLLMAQPVGSSDEQRQRRCPVQSDKKKGCRQGNCSKWKGGKCRCGRE